jgi:hypothetical protein
MIETEQPPVGVTMGKSSRLFAFDPSPVRRDLAFAVASFGVVVGLLHVSEYVAVPAAFAALAVLARRRPGWLVALAVVGNFVYLGALELGGRAPHSALTGMYDAVLGALLLAFAWTRRERIARRLRALPARVWAAAAAFLGCWLVASVALLEHGPNARRFAALMVVLTAPAALAAFGAEREILMDVRRALVALGLILAAVSYLALALGRGPADGRFVPIKRYDPISPAIVVMLGMAVALATLPATRRERLRTGAAVAVLGATSVLYGTRGPVLAGAVALAVILVFAGWRIIPFAAASLTVAVLGAVVVSQFGPVHYYAHLFDSLRSESSQAPAQQAGSGGAAGGAGGRPPISSIHLRREWISQALHEFPDKVVFGHGVTMLVDEAPESKRMGLGGEKIWPHNDFAEAAHALGLLGLLPFLLLVGVPAVALLRLRRWTDRRRACVLAGIFAFAFAESNFSGEIGSDTLLWASAAFVVAQWSDARQLDTS